MLFEPHLCVFLILVKRSKSTAQFRMRDNYIASVLASRVFKIPTAPFDFRGLISSDAKMHARFSRMKSKLRFPFLLIVNCQTRLRFYRSAKTTSWWWMWLTVFRAKPWRCIGADKRKWKCLTWTEHRWWRSAQYRVTRLSNTNFELPWLARIFGTRTQVRNPYLLRSYAANSSGMSVTTSANSCVCVCKWRSEVVLLR